MDRDNYGTIEKVYKVLYQSSINEHSNVENSHRKKRHEVYSRINKTKVRNIISIV
jgi:hypothetical protein